MHFWWAGAMDNDVSGRLNSNVLQRLFVAKSFDFFTLRA